MRHSNRRRGRERGQILVLFELFLIVILGFTALVVDLGFLRNNRQTLVNTFDSAALAGGSLLPVNGAAEATKANALIDKTIQANYPGLPIGNYTITYKCLIGVDPATNLPWLSRDVTGVCDPTHAVGHAPATSDFVGAGPTRVSPCDPSAGDKCNVVVVTGSATTQYAIAPVVGITQGNTGTIVSAACRGACGASPVVPVDLVIVLDRTLSMSASSIASLQDASEAVLSVYNPAQQRVALALVGPSKIDSAYAHATGSCGASTAYGVGDNTNWSPYATLTIADGTTMATTVTTTLNGSINNSTTTVKVVSKTGFPTTFPFNIGIDSEQMQVTAVSGSSNPYTFTVTRAQNHTTAATHNSGATVGLGVDSASTTIKVASATGFPTSGSYTIQVDSEKMTVTGGQGTTTWTVVRGVGSTAATHAPGVPVNLTTIKVSKPYSIYFPSTVPFTIAIDSELMSVTATSGSNPSTWTVTRGTDGTLVDTHAVNAGVYGTAPWTPNADTIGMWVPVGLSGTDSNSVRALPNPSGAAGDYSKTTSDLVKAIECTSSFSDGTDLSTPIAMAQWYLDHYGRQGVTQGIILETDGHPQYGFLGSSDQAGTNSAYTCKAAANAAAAAKADITNSPTGIQVFTIAFGLTDTTYCPTYTTNMTANDGTYNRFEGTDVNGNNWSGDKAKDLLLNMATDSSHFFDAPSAATLKSKFTEAASILVHSGAHLVQLYPSPIVSSAAGPTASVTISGKYFTGASSVMFGSAAAVSYTVSGDSTITAKAPAKPSGTQVDVTVTAAGGTSAITTADHYTYP